MPLESAGLCCGTWPETHRRRAGNIEQYALLLLHFVSSIRRRGGIALRVDCDTKWERLNLLVDDIMIV